MPTPSPHVLRGPVLLALRDAESIREAARLDAAALLADAAEQATALRRAADAAAVVAAARLLTAAQHAAEQALAQQEAALTDLAFEIAARLLGDLPRTVRTAALARAAFADHADASRLAVRVAPAMAAALRGALADTAVVVAEDAALGLDDCVLLHPGGRTELGVLPQLRALFAASAG